MRLAIARDGEEHGRRAICDRDAVMPGRGAYLCVAGSPGQPRSECVRLALRRGALSRALRCKVSLDPELVESVDV
jgi:predicted RNA-binding protein YlxR (DUF448 family)